MNNPPRKDPRSEMSLGMKLMLFLLGIIVLFAVYSFIITIPIRMAKPSGTIAVAPTNTPIPTATRRSTLDLLRVSIDDPSISYGLNSIDGRALIKWRISDYYTEEAIRDDAKQDATNILRAIANGGDYYQSVTIRGTYQMVDTFGNAKEQEVVYLFFMRETVERINWERFSFQDIYLIADESEIHPAFLK